MSDQLKAVLDSVYSEEITDIDEISEEIEELEQKIQQFKKILEWAKESPVIS